MIHKNIITIILLLCCFFILTGCHSVTQQSSGHSQVTAEEQKILEQEVSQNYELQLQLIKAQDEIKSLRKRVNELTNQSEDLETEPDILKDIPPENPQTMEQKYKKLESDNETLRKLVEYERNLRELLQKRVEQDQITINELKSRLEE